MTSESIHCIGILCAHACVRVCSHKLAAESFLSFCTDDVESKILNCAWDFLSVSSLLLICIP